MGSPAPKEPGSPSGPAGSSAARLLSVVREYAFGGQTVRAVDGVTLEVPRGQFLALVGRSGSGKSTLLNLLAGIDQPTSGEIWIGSQEISRLTDDEQTRLRRERIGMVYQFFNLLPTLSVLENVALPALLAGEREAAVLSRARGLLAEMDLLPRANSRPHTLSGGEMQRTAVARALIHAPQLLLADEPTGNLDSRNADQVMAILRRIGDEGRATVLLVTHSREAAACADRIVELRDGRVLRDEVR